MRLERKVVTIKMDKKKGYIDRLNDKQKEAALMTEGPLLILAGAGSGKTSTMTCRIAHLIEEGVQPYNILAVTFTNKAAREMRDRVERLMEGFTEDTGRFFDISDMWIQTFHSACLRILRANAERLGYSRDFAVYDPQDQKTVVKSIIKDLNIEDSKFTPQYVLSIISDKKNKFITPEQYLEENGENFRTINIYKVYREYEKTLRKNNAMDFDDLILNAVRLFEENKDVLCRYQTKFRYIMVDEYQDTNYIQYRFVKLLAQEHQNICVVGDDDQCIYEWRGADIRNILDFEKDFKNAKTIKLEQNYRSCGNILKAANSVVEHNKGRKAKSLWTVKKPGDKIIYRRADDEKEEAGYIAQEISHLEGHDLKYSDFAVLYRTNAQSRVFEEVFSRMDVPYRVLGGLRYYDRKEIKDIISYMRLVQNKDDDLSLLRIINEPKRGVGEKSREMLQDEAKRMGISIFRALEHEEVIDSLPAKAGKAVAEMVKVISEYADEKENLKVSDIYDGVVARTGYLKALEDQKNLEAESRIENILEFRTVISDYENEDPELTLSEFMEKIALISDIDNHDPDENAVSLMTMHSAKGLEFPVVFMPGMEDGLFPSWRSLDSPDGVEEERRLCYVGMTRAKERLYLTSAAQRTIYGRTDYTIESQFIREVDKKLLTGDAVYESGRKSTRDARTDGYSSPDVQKPFDSLKYAKQEIKKAAKANQNAYTAGERVSHAKFGEGLVIETDARTVSVMFDSVGMKKLAKDIAPLRKI